VPWLSAAGGCADPAADAAPRGAPLRRGARSACRRHRAGADELGASRAPPYGWSHPRRTVTERWLPSARRLVASSESTEQPRRQRPIGRASRQQQRRGGRKSQQCHVGVRVRPHHDRSGPIRRPQRRTWHIPGASTLSETTVSAATIGSPATTWPAVSTRSSVSLGPSGVLAVERSAREAAVQDADEPVAQLSEGGVVTDSASSESRTAGSAAFPFPVHPAASGIRVLEVRLVVGRRLDPDLRIGIVSRGRWR
jgi:hypothetical protein